MKFFDSHCHLDLLANKLDLNQVFKQCWRKHVKRILMPGVSKANWGDLSELMRQPNQFVQLDYAIGLHPYFMNQHHLGCLQRQTIRQKKDHVENDLETLASLLSTQTSCVAVGEIGLDFSPNLLIEEGAVELQKTLFYQQLQLAKQNKLPVIIHHRKSIDTLCQLIRQAHFDYGGVIHAFSGSGQQAHQLIDLGFKLGVGGTITYPRAQKTRQVIAKINAEHLLLETDSPDMPLFGKQGHANSPEYIPEIFNQLVELQQADAETLNDTLWQNNFDCFPRLNLSQSPL